jgi:hypothetical protein
MAMKLRLGVVKLGGRRPAPSDQTVCKSKFRLDTTSNVVVSIYLTSNL